MRHMRWVVGGGEPGILRLVMATAVAAALACDTGSEAGTSFASVAAAQAAATVFSPGVISDSRWQYRITFTSDGRTAYFTVADDFFPRARRSSIYVSHRHTDGGWSSPELAPFSGTYTDIDPFITPDGRRLYFSSIRPVNGVPKADLDVFYMELTPEGWGAPVRLGPEVNSALDELYASLDEAGTLYVASGPARPTPDARWEIFRAEPRGSGFAPREPIRMVNVELAWNAADPTGNWTFNPEVSANGRTLIFTSLRSGGFGHGDLYVSHLEHGQWSAPRNLGPLVNSANDEFHPTLSRDGRTLYFARTILVGALVPSDLYSVPTSAFEAFER